MILMGCGRGAFGSGHETGGRCSEKFIFDLSRQKMAGKKKRAKIEKIS
jgi:hypothetical protein